jgi:hypothetical protein
MDAARASRVIVLTGQPGVGKTVLAVHWGYQVHRDFPDGVLSADVHGYAPDGPASPFEELPRFRRALGAEPQQVPASATELISMYRSLTARRRLLVVLDDALTAAQVVPLLPSSQASVAVVTSRVRLGGLAARGARVVQVDRLDGDAALELLARTWATTGCLPSRMRRASWSSCARGSAGRLRGRGPSGRQATLAGQRDGPGAYPRDGAARGAGPGGRHDGPVSA